MEIDPSNRSRTPRVLAVTFLALAGCLWGTGFLFGKIAFREMTVSENVAFRFLTATAVLFPILLRQRVRYRTKDWKLLLVAAAIGVPLQFLVQFKGLQLTTVSHASLIVGFLPVLLALSAALFLKEKLHPLDWAMLALSALGAVFIALSSLKSTGGPQPPLKGDLLVLLSMFAAVGHDSLQ
jgi:drug/metabolite transporter (DMT)-like permease